MELSIKYEEIQNSIAKFNTTKEKFINEINNGVNAINNYKSEGLTIDDGSYNESLSKITSTLETEKEQILNDCNRIERYLNAISDKAREAITQSITAAEAVSTFEASGNVVKRG